LTDEYICGHLGEDQANYYGAVVPPIFQNSLHVFPSIEEMQAFDGKQEGKYMYGRHLNPTVDIVQKKLAALERADKAALFGSGMAAITAAILSCVKTGDHVVGLHHMYGPAHRFLSEYLAKFGVEASFVSGASLDELEQALRLNTRLIYLESPTTFYFALQDLAAVATLAKARGILTVIDNTWCTPLYQKPLELGIDLVVHSVTKYLAGHSDVISGVVAGREELIERVNRNERDLLGGIPGPFDAWLILRGMRTLPVRMRQHQENALVVASFLEGHPRVSRVNWPGLASHPQHELGRRQMKGYSGLLSFELDCGERERNQFFNALKLFRLGVSWGGFESLVVKGPNNLVRLAVGLERAEDLLADLETAFKSC